MFKAKRILSAVIMLAMVISLIPAFNLPAAAEGGDIEIGYTFSPSGLSVTLYSDSNYNGKCLIVASYSQDKRLTGIRTQIFSLQSGVVWEKNF